MCVCVCGHFKVLTRRIFFGFEHKSRVASRLGCACCGGLVSVATQRRAYEDQRASVGEIRLTALVWQLYTSAGRTSGCSERNLRLDVDPAESARRSHRRTASAHRLCARLPTEPRLSGFGFPKTPRTDWTRAPAPQPGAIPRPGWPDDQLYITVTQICSLFTGQAAPDTPVA